MRTSSLLSLLFAVVLSALTLATASANPLVGTWVHDNPAAAERIVCVFRPDGTGSIDDDTIRYQLSPDLSTLRVTLDGEVITYTVRIDGDTLTARGGDFEGTLTFKRTPSRAPLPSPAPPTPVSPSQTPPAPGQPAGPTTLAPTSQPASRPAVSPLVGTWTDGNGRIRFNADGSCDYLGQKLSYTYDGTTVTLKGPAATVQFAATVDRDTLTTRVNGEVQTLTRVPENPQPGNAAQTALNPNSPAGVYVVSESSIDPSNALVITQYLTLWPDGSVSWAKSELGASRTAVSEQLERFSAFRNGGDKGQILGRWQASPDGRSVVVQWNVWNNLRCQGLFDPASGTLRLEKMGILQDSATLDYKRQ